CCSTAAQVWPQSSSPHSAASAIRRSPGGSTPNSRRSRPEEPPLSATVTTPVRSAVTRRSAERVTESPCPPPNATTGTSRRGPRAEASGRAGSLTPEVTVAGAGIEAEGQEPLGDLLAHRDAAVLATRAAD